MCLQEKSQPGGKSISLVVGHKFGFIITTDSASVDRPDDVIAFTDRGNSPICSDFARPFIWYKSYRLTPMSANGVSKEKPKANLSSLESVKK